MEKIKLILFKFVKENWILILILLIGAFFRLYKIGDYMTFLGDEGRDAIIVRNLLVKFDPILIGPGTSVGNMYLGPLYYYFMGPFLFLANYSPVGPSIGVSLLGVMTIYLVYIAGKNWFNKNVGLTASFLYAISPTVIIYSHSSWNPNIMPFFSLLSIYSIWKVWKEKNYIWLLITAVSLAFVLQSHYLGVLIFPVIITFWYLSKVPKKITFFSLLIFIFLMSPLLIFDFRHNFLNSKALYEFLFNGDGVISFGLLTIIRKIFLVFGEINTSLLAAKEPFGKIINIVLAFWIIYRITKTRKNIKNNEGFYLIIFWIAVSLIGLGIYGKDIYDHYFGFLFPAPFLLMALFIDSTIRRSKFIGILLLIVISSISLINNPFKSPGNYQMRRAINVTNKIIKIANGKPFNFSVLAERNYEDGYQYFLEKENVNFVEIDAQIPETVQDQLIVVCEMEKTKCDPTHSAKAEVANFGWSKIEGEWEIDGVIIYKLIHTK